MSIKRNAIPLLGKFIPKTLMDNIYKKGVKEIKILLDKDAQDQALYYVNYFMNNGITVTNILPTEKDAGDMGFTEVNKMLKQTKKSGFEENTAVFASSDHGDFGGDYLVHLPVCLPRVRRQRRELEEKRLRLRQPNA